VRHGTTASEGERQALASYFAGLNGTATDAGVRLFSYWRADPAPSVSAFLASERHKMKAVQQ
jgi:hypothetical protein